MNAEDALLEENRAMKAQLKKLKSELQELQKHFVLGYDVFNGVPLDMKMFDEMEGRKLYVPSQKFIAGRTLRLFRAYRGMLSCVSYVLKNGIRIPQDKDIKAFFINKWGKSVQFSQNLYCKGDTVDIIQLDGHIIDLIEPL
jgi:hypothetical protein